MALAFLLAGPAHAAHWAVTYACSGTNTLGSGTPVSWAPTQNTDPASESCGYSPQSPSAVSNGSLTATLTWTSNGEPTLPPAPSKVYLLQTLTCSATGSSSGCTVTDGWGDTFPGSGTTSCSGQFAHSLQMDNSALKTTLTLQPVTATVSAYNATGAGGNCYASIKLTTAAVSYALNITLMGTTLDGSGANNILVGQGCTASLTPTGCTVSSPYQWSVSGNTFQSWTASASSAVRDPKAGFPGYGDPAQATAHWYWSDAAANETVTCTAMVTPPAGQGSPLQVTATQTVQLQTPSISENNTRGLVRLDNGASAIYKSPYALFLGPPVGTTGRGITWTANVNTPAPFSSQGPGTWQFAQIITPTASRTPSGGTAQASSNNGLSGCDGAYPYGGGAYFGDNSSHNSGDSPGFGIQDTYSNYQVTQTFRTYIMYQPPPAATANGVMLVPLWEIDWNWTANATETGGSWANWPVGKSPGSFTITSSQKQTVHPTWTMLVSPPPVW